MVKNYFYLFFVIVFLSQVSSLTERDIFLSQDFETSYNTYTKEETFTSVSDNSAFKIGNKNYMNIANDSKVSFDSNGRMIEASLTASQDTSWEFEGKKYNLKEGMQLKYFLGRVTITSNEGYSVSDYAGNYFTINFPKSSIQNSLSFGNDTISGKNFFLGQTYIISGNIYEISYNKGALESFRLDGGEFVHNSVQTRVMDSAKIFIEPNDEIFAEKNAIGFLQDELIVITNNPKGKPTFNINFLKENPYAEIETDDRFELKISGKTRAILSDREKQQKIPLLEVREANDMTLIQNSREINIRDGKVFYKKSSDINSQSSFLWTSPVELDVKTEKDVFIITNFKGIASVERGKQQGITDVRIQNSIYYEPASTSLRFNYPTKENFEDSFGISLNFINGNRSSLLDNPINMRNLINFYSTLPEDVKRAAKQEKLTIIMVSPEEYKNQNGPEVSYAFYRPVQYSREFFGRDLGLTTDIDHEIVFQAVGSLSDNQRYIPNTDFRTFRHELAHFYDFHTRNPERNLPIGKWSSEFKNEWVVSNSIQPDKSLLDPIDLNKNVYSWSTRLNVKKDSPYGGYVRPYGNTKVEEDIATFVETVTSNPSFFKKHNLLLDSAGQKTVYHQKIDLLYKYGQITEQEYKAIFIIN